MGFLSRRLLPKRRLAAAGIVSFFILSTLGVHALRTAGAAQVSLVGKAASVVYQSEQRTVVLFAGTGADVNDLAYWLDKKDISRCDLLVNLGSKELEDVLRSQIAPDAVFAAADLADTAAELSLEEHLQLQVARQKDGAYAVLACGGKAFGCSRGKIALPPEYKVEGFYAATAPPVTLQTDAYMGTKPPGSQVAFERALASGYTYTACFYPHKESALRWERGPLLWQ